MTTKEQFIDRRMASSVKCPKCGDRKLYYVMLEHTYHYIENYPNQDGYVDLICQVDSQVVEDFMPYLKCFKCTTKFTLDLKEAPDGEI